MTLTTVSTTVLYCDYVQELVLLAHDDVVYYGKGVRTQEMKIVPICGGSILAQNIETTKLSFIKTALLKNKIITIFEKRLHKSFVS